MNFRLTRDDAKELRPDEGTWHIYVDETVFLSDDREHMIGVGALVVPSPVQPQVTEQALGNLLTDPGRALDSVLVQSLDDQTLRRRIFHAADDSKNAHSWLARAIRANVVGRFLCTFTPRASTPEERAFRENSANSLLLAISSVDQISIVFEERSGFSRTSAAELVTKFYDSLDESTYDLPHAKTYYPRVILDVQPKANAGLQVTDFLLWSVVQERFHPKSTKAPHGQRAGLTSFYTGSYQGDPLRWATYALNTTVDAAFGLQSLEHYPLSAPKRVFDESNEQELAELYFLAERALRGYSRSTLPPQAAHLQPDLDRIVRRLDSANDVGLEEIRTALRMFLRMFDMVPIYDRPDLDDAAWLKLVRAKRFLSLALREDVLHGVRTLLHVATMRQRARRIAPQVLGL